MVVEDPGGLDKAPFGLDAYPDRVWIGGRRGC